VRAPRPEKNGAREVDQRKQNPRAAEPEKSLASGPDQKKRNPRAAALNFSENHLRHPVNLDLKRKVPVKEQRKARKHGLTGNQKGAKLILRLLGNKESNPQSEFAANRSADFGGFYRSCVRRQVFHTGKPDNAGKENYSGHKQECHVHICVTTNVSQ
jgi:hypothetical protein